MTAEGLPDDVLKQVERRLDVRLDLSEVKTGAWAESAGYLTDRGTWARIDSRTVTSIQPQSWIGAEAASVIRDVPKPAWFQSASWTDADRGRVWRVDEMERISEPAIVSAGAGLTHMPELPKNWWSQLRTALTSLARFRTFRVSGRQELVTRRISQVFGGTVDTAITEWATVHGDLHWGNLTAPKLYLLDWGDWGLAPRGNDVAALWGTSLAVPELADRVLAEFSDDLESRSGRIARLWICSNIVRNAARRNDLGPIANSAQTAADQLLKSLS